MGHDEAGCSKIAETCCLSAFGICRNAESCCLQVVPVAGIGLAHHLRLVDADAGADETGRSESHGHAMVFVGIYAGLFVGRAPFAVPPQDTVLFGVYHVAQFPQFGNEGTDAVSFLDFKAL